jgi:hypothetical protein
MNERISVPLQALPDGEAELRLVLRLSWEDIAVLGAEAGRLAAQMQRPVTLDEAASHRLRARSAAHAKPAQPVTPPVTQSATVPASASSATVSSLTGRSPSEQARQAIEKINGSGGYERDAATPRTAS